MIKKLVVLLSTLLIFTSCSGDIVNKNELDIAESNSKNIKKSIEQNIDGYPDDTLEEYKKINDYIIRINGVDYKLDLELEDTLLKGLSIDELGILRNAIFGKHGYKFKSNIYKEYFDTIEWYQSQYDDVDHLINDIDNLNIRKLRIVELLTTDKNSSVRCVENDNYYYIFEFLSLDSTRTSKWYDRVIIYDDTNYKMIPIFDTKDSEDCEFVVDSEDLNLDDTVIIIDSNKDDEYEFHIRIEKDFFSSVMVIRKVNEEYANVFCDAVYPDVEYIDVDGNGTNELINYFPGGGGYIQIWTGLNLVNEFVEGRFVFSYDLTRMYYQNLLNDAKYKFENEPLNENFVTLLNLYADMGLGDLCKKAIYGNHDLVNDNSYDYTVHLSGDPEIFEDYFGYVTSRAYYYGSTWESLE